jgi:hypothetical protein
VGGASYANADIERMQKIAAYIMFIVLLKVSLQHTSTVVNFNFFGNKNDFYIPDV